MRSENGKPETTDLRRPTDRIIIGYFGRRLELTYGAGGNIQIMRTNGEGGDFSSVELAEVINKFVSERL